MYRCFNPPILQHLVSPEKSGAVMPAVYPLQGHVMYTLETQFDPYVQIPLSVGGKKIGPGIIDLIRPGGDYELPERGQLETAVIETSEFLNRAEGIRVGLEIEKQDPGSVTSGKKLHSPLYLQSEVLRSGFVQVDSPGTGDLTVTAAFPGTSSRPVRTGETRINSNPIGRGTVALFQIRRVASIRQSGHEKMISRSGSFRNPLDLPEQNTGVDKEPQKSVLFGREQSKLYPTPHSLS
jgi:hypothetical protein